MSKFKVQYVSLWACKHEMKRYDKSQLRILYVQDPVIVGPRHGAEKVFRFEVRKLWQAIV